MATTYVDSVLYVLAFVQSGGNVLPNFITSKRTFLSMKRRINNQLDADKLRFIDVISSTCFGLHYAHHQEYRSEPTDRL
jgi:hypothetical protein